jgi:pyridoxamine 5'-phosphate oxidase
MSDPADLRRDYAHGSLDDATLADTWLDQFRRWFDVAVAEPAVLEANAMQLATVGEDGRPSVRSVLLKGLDERGLVFYTNYASAKARDLAVNPYAAVVFTWLAHERQVRLSGPVSKVSAEQTAAYWATRPRGSQVGAWASPQSEVVSSRAQLDALVDAVVERFGAGPIPPPPNWGGYRLAPDVVEFWQGRRDRLHDRVRYRLEGGSWVRERLAP